MSVDDTTHSECAFCDHQVFLNADEHVNLDDATASLSGYAHVRCFERWQDGQSERAHARREAVKYGLGA